MARVKGTNTSPELLLRRGLWHSGFRYRLNRRIQNTRPDIVFPSGRVAVFVDGCFWHGCPSHYVKPKSRSHFWADKLAANVDRDTRQTLELESEGWRVVRIWEHEVKDDTRAAVRLVEDALTATRWSRPQAWRVYRVMDVPDCSNMQLLWLKRLEERSEIVVALR
jgi:DNA mismatch endonuclease (patch repair protein)